MNENILKALIQLFALVIDIDNSGMLPEKERKFVESFLGNLLNKDLIQKYLSLFDDFLKLYADNIADISAKKKRKLVMLDAMKVMAICEQINQELEQKQKTFVLLKLLEFISLGEKISERELDFVLSVATAFNIDETEYQNCRNFVFDTIETLPEKQHILYINADKSNPTDGTLHKYLGNITGSIVFLHIKSTNTFAFRYFGNQDIYLNGQNITPKQVYTFETGSSLRSATITTLYYTDVVKVFMNLPEEISTSLIARDIEFRFRNSENGVRLRDLAIDSGQLVGIMGASGSGKSTLLNILNGNIKPQTGQVFINGYDLYDENHEGKSSIIGYVPQDDILFEELTVYQNLHFNAQLCLNNYAEEKRKELVEKTLFDLDLYEIKDLRVGSLLNKYISGGQRKRLNIALELIREPSVLFVDEPTSGLSSVDSEMVMNLLKEQTQKGKIVIVNIHQPSSDIFKMFDRMLFLDKGGYLIYSGNPIDAIKYFKSKSNYINAEEEQCFECGNVNPEQLLQIIESRIVNEYGKLTRTRKISPKEWFDSFHETQEKNAGSIDRKQSPHQIFQRPPKKFKQFQIFLNRDLLTKIANRQYLLISLLEAPILAVLLGYFTKYISGKVGSPDAYIFMENTNLPAFIFMAVVVALFFGLSISAEEIIKDRKHLKRESFLGLSRNSYLHSKISLMFLISAIQMITFVLISNYILEIRGMTFHYWLILFSASCFANMLGLNISSALNSVITIYILIPFILVPELLFSGIIVHYDKLHKSITTPVYVPVIGDLMTSRWAFEALMVHQFKSNEFQQHFFDIEKDISTASYYKDYLIVELQNRITFCDKNLGNVQYEKEIMENLRLLNYEIDKLTRETGVPFAGLAKLNRKTVSVELLQETNEYLMHLNEVFRKNRIDASKRNDEKYYELVRSLGGKEAFIEFKQKYFNRAISDLVTNRDGIKKIIQVEDKLIQLKDPIYKNPDSNYGRAHFYASYKQLGSLEIYTYWFNLFFIWITTLFLYAALRWNLLRKLLNSYNL
jgi:ABC-type multidrug transport system ATPase subunit